MAQGITTKSDVTPEVSHRTEFVPKDRGGRFEGHMLRFGSSKSRDDLDAVRNGELSTHQEDIYTAKKMGNISLLYCLIETCLCAFMGVGWGSGSTTIDGGSATYVFVCYTVYRSLLIAKSVADQNYFISDEARIARSQKRPESQLGILHQSNESLDTSAVSSNASVQTISPPPSRPVSVTKQRSTAREGQVEFGLPGRTDTEADIGLLPLSRRRTNPPLLREQSL
jgi:hypothetical protein